MTMDFEGIEEIQRKLEELGGEKLLYKVNREIIWQVQDLAADIAGPQLPKSGDISTSGPKRMLKSRRTPMDHMFEAIPISGITKKQTAMGGWIGWKPSDNYENFYAKFHELGVEQHRAYSNGKRPVPGIKGKKIFSKTASQIRPMLNALGMAEYQKLLKEAIE